MSLGAWNLILLYRKAWNQVVSIDVAAEGTSSFVGRRCTDAARLTVRPVEPNAIIGQRVAPNAALRFIKSAHSQNCPYFLWNLWLTGRSKEYQHACGLGAFCR